MSVEAQWLRGLAGRQVLLTGSRGYLGRQLVRMLAQADCRLLCHCRQAPSAPQPPAQAAIDYFCGDLAEPRTWRKALPGSDVVFHLAAQTSLRAAEQDPLADHQSNVLPILTMLQRCCELSSAPRVLLAGTVTQAGLTRRGDEPQADCPASVYDLHKLMAEQYLEYYTRRGVVQGAGLRLPNVYGPGPDRSGKNRGVLNTMVRRACAGEALTIYGTGEQLRNFIYIDDAVRALLLAAVNIEAVAGKHFVVAGDEVCSIKDAFQLVAERVSVRTGSVVPIIHVEPPEPQAEIELRDFVGDSAAFRQATHWQPACLLAEGIDRTADAIL